MGKVPVRSSANGWLPVPGWTGEHEWQGYIPFDEMPRSVNPEQQYIATANNKPVGDDYPHYISVEFTPGLPGEAGHRGTAGVGPSRRAGHGKGARGASVHSGLGLLECHGPR